MRSLFVPLLLTALLLLAIPANASPLPTLTPDGPDLRTPEGEPVVLRGCNLGNWLLLEPWMFGFYDSPEHPMRAQHDLLTLFEHRFGAERAAELLRLHREGWITPRDMANVRSFGFNAVRLPLHYSLFVDDKHATQLRPDAFEWTDRAINLAREEGLYVILDLHGAPGGQSVDGPTGRVGQNRLWTDERCQATTLMIWQALAERYKDEPVVAAYDLINEPYGDMRSNTHAPALVALVARLHDAVRAVDPDTLIFAPATIAGLSFYPDPRDAGWTNVAFTEHFYPGLFGTGSPSIQTHRAFAASTLVHRKAWLAERNAGYLIGEFNPVFDSAGGPAMMHAHFDRYADNAWHATMWSYKVYRPQGNVDGDGWGLATNPDPLTIHPATASYDELETWFRNADTAPLAIDTALRTELTTRNADTDLLLGSGEPIRPAAHTTDPEGWRSTDIGSAAPGATTPTGDAITIDASGADIFAATDSFRFVHRAVDGDFRLHARIERFDAADRYAKAGLMLRASTKPDAPHVLLHTFPDGRIVLAHRAHAGGQTAERVLATNATPIGLALAREGDTLIARFTDAEGLWHDVPLDASETPASLNTIGFAVCSHQNGAYARARFDTIDFHAGTQNHANTEPTRSPTPTYDPGRLANGSFESAAPNESHAAGWGVWGEGLVRHTAWSPTREGHAMIGYEHWRLTGNQNAGIFQDVPGATPGTPTTFRVSVYPDRVDPGTHPFQSVEVRLEDEYRGVRVTLASRTYTPADLLAGAWNELHLTARPLTDTVRVLVIVEPARGHSRGGALKIDACALIDGFAPPSDTPHDKAERVGLFSHNP